MKTSPLVSLLAAVSLCVAPLAPAAAQPPQPYRSVPHRHPHPHPAHVSASAVVGATLLIGGLALALNATRPPPVVLAPPLIAPPVAVGPPPPVWYWCAAFGTYYPYVANCPGGWRAVPAR